MNKREKIAEICGDAKYADGASVSWEYYGDYEKSLAYDKADQILALIDPDQIRKEEE